jgi:hypothetical protein
MRIFFIEHYFLIHVLQDKTRQVIVEKTSSSHCLLHLDELGWSQLRFYGKG